MNDLQSNKPRFIAVEGLEGSGKTTTINYINKLLTQKGVARIKQTREPGSTPLGEQIRNLLKTTPAKEISDTTECLLFYAARANLIEQVILPQLQQGTWILSDRFNLSSLAYQGYGKSLQKLTGSLTKLVVKDVQPDLTIFLDVDPEVGLNRAKKRGALDRIEQQSIEYFNSIRNYFTQQAELSSEIEIVNSNLNQEQVNQQIQQIIETKVARWI